MQRALLWAVGLVFVVSATLAGAAQPAGAAGKKAVKGEHGVKLGDPTGDVKPITSSEGKEAPGLDVVEFALESDGVDLTVSATLKSKVGTYADTVIEMEIDTDNNLETGGKSFFLETGGFERQVALNACLDYVDGTSACIGTFDTAVKRFYAMTTVKRYSGKDSATEPTAFSSPFPSDGKVIRAKIKYSDLGAKPGQTLRIVAREASAGLELDAYFPDILLTLK